MSDRVDQLRAAGVLSPLDVHLARALTRMAGETREEVTLAAALVSRFTAAGHVCLAMRELDASALSAGLTAGATSPPVTLPETEGWISLLRSSPLVGAQDAPLVLDDRGRLYLERYWRYQELAATELERRASEIIAVERSPDTTDALERLFPSALEGPTDPTRRAAEGTLSRRLTVITGGPGTGKTSAVLRLLALLVEDRQATGAPPLRATLLAPTGKAAARLAESIRERVSSLPCSDSVRHAIPIATSTIHRALGWRKDHPTRFRHDERHPLQTDVVVVDEASMVDLALLSKLLAATPKHARMVLLGDEDQLASVEVGAILGDICNAPARSQNSNAPIAQCIFRLEKSHRFGAESGIGALAHAIQAEDADAALSILNDPARSDVRLVSGGPGLGLDRSLRDEVLTHYRAYLEAESPNERAVAFGRFRVLCAHAAGPRGVSAVNQEVERTLARAGLLSPKDAWYPGRPIMVRENDYSLDLYNGDIGFIMKAENGDLRAHFVSGDGSVRSLSPGRLPQHDTVFGMTIHKSQGSEMDHVSVVLPDQVSLVISRELLYTAVTRARHHVTVYARPEVLRAAVERRIQRASGLTDRLWRSGA